MKSIMWAIAMAVLSLVLGIGYATAALAGTEAKPIKLKTVTIFPETNQTAKPFIMFRDRVNKLAKGELVIDYIGGPEAIPMFEQGKAVSAGVVDMAFVFSASYAGLVKAEGWLTTSQIPYDKEREVGFHDFMNEEHNKAGIYYLGRGAAGYAHKEPRKFHLWLNKKIKTPRDLAGMKIGGVSPAMNAYLKKLGTAPVVLSSSDLYSALERGVVDGLWNGMGSFISLGGLKAVKYYIDHRFATDNTVFIVNLKVWNKLPAHLQSLLKEVAIGVERDYPSQEVAYVEKGWNMMRNEGIEFIRFSPADAEWFSDIFYKVQWDKMKKIDPKNVSRVERMLLR